MIVVSDTSPLANLVLIGKLDLLEVLFGEILVPTAVHSEILKLRPLGHDISSYEKAAWIKIRDAGNQTKTEELMQHLDEGESEAIALALEIRCNLILMDERLGTKIARTEGLSTIGLIGVLLLAKQKDIIPALKPILAELKTKAGFWLGASFLEQILNDAGEV